MLNNSCWIITTTQSFCEWEIFTKNKVILIQPNNIINIRLNSTLNERNKVIINTCLLSAIAFSSTPPLSPECAYLLSSSRPLDGRVFVSLASGELMVYRRVGNSWPKDARSLHSVSTPTAPVTKMLPVAGRLWCASGAVIKIISLTSLHVEVRITLECHLLSLFIVVFCEASCVLY